MIPAKTCPGHSVIINSTSLKNSVVQLLFDQIIPDQTHNPFLLSLMQKQDFVENKMEKNLYLPKKIGNINFIYDDQPSWNVLLIKSLKQELTYLPTAGLINGRPVNDVYFPQGNSRVSFCTLTVQVLPFFFTAFTNYSLRGLSHETNKIFPFLQRISFVFELQLLF